MLKQVQQILQRPDHEEEKIKPVKQDRLGGFRQWMSDLLENIRTWQWTKALLYWLVISAGTMSELAFMAAALWISINASVHALILNVMSESLSRGITQFSTAAYVALPELILGLAIVTTISHFKTWRYSKDTICLAWAILYAIPTTVFLILSAITLWYSVNNASFILPPAGVSIRAMAGYWYALLSLLYWRLGQPQEKERLQKKDTLLTALTEEKEKMQASYQSEIAGIRDEMASLYKQLEVAIAEKKSAYTQLHQHSEDALQAWGENVISLLNQQDKTILIDDIARETGLHRRVFLRAIEGKEVQIKGTNKDRIWTPSLREWLERHPPKDGYSRPNLHVVNE